MTRTAGCYRLMCLAGATASQSCTYLRGPQGCPSRDHLLPLAHLLKALRGGGGCREDELSRCRQLDRVPHLVEGADRLSTGVASFDPDHQEMAVAFPEAVSGHDLVAGDDALHLEKRLHLRDAGDDSAPRDGLLLRHEPGVNLYSLFVRFLSPLRDNSGWYCFWLSAQGGCSISLFHSPVEKGR